MIPSLGGWKTTEDKRHDRPIWPAFIEIYERVLAKLYLLNHLQSRETVGEDGWTRHSQVDTGQQALPYMQVECVNQRLCWDIIWKISTEKHCGIF